MDGPAEGVRSMSVEEKKDPKVKETRNKLFLLDVIAGQVDRHHKNFLIEMDGGQVKGVKGIDLDLAFGPGYTGKFLEEWNERINSAQGTKLATEKALLVKKIAGDVPWDLSGIDQEFARRIIQLSKSGQHLVRDALTGYISDQEIESTLSRLKTLAKFMKPIVEALSGLVISEK